LNFNRQEKLWFYNHSYYSRQAVVSRASLVQTVGSSYVCIRSGLAISCLGSKFVAVNNVEEKVLDYNPIWLLWSVIWW